MVEAVIQSYCKQERVFLGRGDSTTAPHPTRSIRVLPALLLCLRLGCEVGWIVCVRAAPQEIFFKKGIDKAARI